MIRIGIDTGGTFTDLVWWEDGRTRSHKVPSTPDDPSRAILGGLAQLARVVRREGDGPDAEGGRRDEEGRGGPEPSRAPEAAAPVRPEPAGRSRQAERQGNPLPAGAAVVHGTTVATNALLERKVAPVALLATSGFEDLLVLGRQDRPSLYDPSVFPPWPLVPGPLRFGIAGRLGPEGREESPLDLESVDAAVQAGLAAGARRFAIAFLHAYANPSHEQAAGERVRLAGGRPTLSSWVLPEYREYERTSATVINAALEPVLETYLGRLAERLAGTRLSVFRSNGGILSAAAASEAAVETLLSGPAAGVIGAWEWGQRSGLERLITFDMGGTSTDVSLCDGGVGLTTESEVAGYLVRIPMVDIHTVGAGGGSIARRESGGALGVGPESAGADPGPACYGRGTEATVTDAQLVLGRLPEGRFLGGRMALDRPRAQAALERLGASLGLGPEAAAAGIIEVANAGMERALRVVSVARGHDPREFPLFCFGGAAGLHAVDLAEALGMPEVIVPPSAGVFSAAGLLSADVVRDASRGLLLPLAVTGRAAREAMFAPLEARLIAEMEREGFGAAGIALVRTLDLRYRGQSFEINVAEGKDIEAAFHALHRRRYEHDRPGVAIEIVALRVRAVGKAGTPPDPAPLDPAQHPPVPRETRMVWFTGGRRATAHYHREELAPGHRFPGPALISEEGATTVLPPGWGGMVDRMGNLRLGRDAMRSPRPTP